MSSANNYSKAGTEFAMVIMLVSSTKINDLVCFNASSKSLIIKNNKGPKHDPWGYAKLNFCSFH